MNKPKTYSPEVWELAVRMVFEHEKDHESQWVPMRSISEKIGCPAETLRKWVPRADRDHGQRPGLPTEERTRLKELERKNRELKRVNEILRKASGYFARPKLDPPTPVIVRFMHHQRADYGDDYFRAQEAPTDPLRLI